MAEAGANVQGWFSWEQHILDVLLIFWISLGLIVYGVSNSLTQFFGPIQRSSRPGWDKSRDVRYSSSKASAPGPNQPESCFWLNSALNWVFLHYNYVPEFVDAWIQSLNEQAVKLGFTDKGPVQIKFEKVESGSLPPKFGDVTFDSGPEDVYVVECSVDSRDLSLGVFASQQTHEGVKLTNLIVSVLKLKGHLRLRCYLEGKDMMAEASFHGRPTVQVTSKATNQYTEPSDMVDVGVVEEVVRNTICLSTTTFNISQWIQGHGHNERPPVLQSFSREAPPSPSALAVPGYAPAEVSNTEPPRAEVFEAIQVQEAQQQHSAGFAPTVQEVAKTEPPVPEVLEPVEVQETQQEQSAGLTPKVEEVTKSEPCEPEVFEPVQVQETKQEPSADLTPSVEVTDTDAVEPEEFEPVQVQETQQEPAIASTVEEVPDTEPVVSEEFEPVDVKETQQEPSTASTIDEVPDTEPLEPEEFKPEKLPYRTLHDLSAGFVPSDEEMVDTEPLEQEEFEHIEVQQTEQELSDEFIPSDEEMIDTELIEPYDSDPIHWQEIQQVQCAGLAPIIEDTEPPETEDFEDEMTESQEQSDASTVEEVIPDTQSLEPEELEPAEVQETQHKESEIVTEHDLSDVPDTGPLVSDEIEPEEIQEIKQEVKQEQSDGDTRADSPESELPVVVKKSHPEPVVEVPVTKPLVCEEYDPIEVAETEQEPVASVPRAETPDSELVQEVPNTEPLVCEEYDPIEVAETEQEQASSDIRAETPDSELPVEVEHIQPEPVVEVPVTEPLECEEYDPIEVAETEQEQVSSIPRAETPDSELIQEVPNTEPLVCEEYDPIEVAETEQEQASSDIRAETPDSELPVEVEHIQPEPVVEVPVTEPLECEEYDPIEVAETEQEQVSSVPRAETPDSELIQEVPVTEPLVCEEYDPIEVAETEQEQVSSDIRAETPDSELPVEVEHIQPEPVAEVPVTEPLVCEEYDPIEVAETEQEQVSDVPRPDSPDSELTVEDSQPKPVVEVLVTEPEVTKIEQEHSVGAPRADSPDSELPVEVKHIQKEPVVAVPDTKPLLCEEYDPIEVAETEQEQSAEVTRSDSPDSELPIEVEDSQPEPVDEVADSKHPESEVFEPVKLQEIQQEPSTAPTVEEVPETEPVVPEAFMPVQIAIQETELGPNAEAVGRDPPQLEEFKPIEMEETEQEPAIVVTDSEPKPAVIEAIVVQESQQDQSDFQVPTLASSPTRLQQKPAFPGQADKRLLVKVIKASGLKQNDGSVDPYCIAYVDTPPQSEVTSVVRSSFNPFWDEQFYFDLTRDSRDLRFEILDKKRPPNDNFLGEAVVDVQDLRQNPSSRQIIPLQGRLGAGEFIAGSITVEFLCSDPSEETVSPRRTIETSKSVTPGGTLVTTTTTTTQKPQNHRYDTTIDGSPSYIEKRGFDYNTEPDGGSSDVLHLNGGESVTETAIRALSERSKLGKKTPTKTSTLIITGVRREMVKPRSKTLESSRTDEDIAAKSATNTMSSPEITYSQPKEKKSLASRIRKRFSRSRSKKRSLSADRASSLRRSQHDEGSDLHLVPPGTHAKDTRSLSFRGSTSSYTSETDDIDLHKQKPADVPNLKKSKSLGGSLKKLFRRSRKRSRSVGRGEQSRESSVSRLSRHASQGPSREGSLTRSSHSTNQQQQQQQQYDTVIL